MKSQQIVIQVSLICIGVLIGLFVKSQLSAQQVPPGGESGPSPAPSSFSLPQSTAPIQEESVSVPAANPADPSISQHTLPSGGRTDIVQIGSMTTSQSRAYTGDDITFTVTIENVAPYKKFVRQLCFNSAEGNFGCSPGFNLNPGQIFSISNSGRFTSSGIKSVGVTWTQDGVNFYSPVNASSATVTIL